MWWYWWMLRTECLWTWCRMFEHSWLSSLSLSRWFRRRSSYWMLGYVFLLFTNLFSSLQFPIIYNHFFLTSLWLLANRFVIITVRLFFPVQNYCPFKALQNNDRSVQGSFTNFYIEKSSSKIERKGCQKSRKKIWIVITFA